jgi:hypothetical protein
VVLANLDPPAAEAVGRRVRAWLGAEDEDRPRRRTPPAAAPPSPRA